MNRIVVFGLAMFFALVGIALVGGENKASAFIFGGGGYGGGGCCGGGSCGGGGCHQRHQRCSGRSCHQRHHRCHGRCSGGGCNGGGGCCGGGGCGGGGYSEAVQAPMGPEKQAPMPAQAPAK